MPNINAVDIRAKAIGTPKKISVRRTGNIQVTISIIYISFRAEIRDTIRKPVFITSETN